MGQDCQQNPGRDAGFGLIGKTGQDKFLVLVNQPAAAAIGQGGLETLHFADIDQRFALIGPGLGAPGAGRQFERLGPLQGADGPDRDGQRRN